VETEFPVSPEMENFDWLKGHYHTNTSPNTHTSCGLDRLSSLAINKCMFGKNRSREINEGI